MKEKLLEIVNIIRDNKQLARLENLNPKDDLRTDLGLDSLDLAEFTVRVESEFGVDVFSDGLVNSIDEVLFKLEK
ncbi:MAG: acyl carrier protein [Calditrichaeota bacterium]|nr:acyl carrier protein [Calditrichota bacterium]HQU71421.1 phosphopantetheine-binding protein [Calditrichia bacterium]